jgi:dephospho-CoA kinase
VLVVGLTGGIGTGKSTFAVLLAERGAQVIDADLLGRDAVRPGRPAWHSIVDQFGDEVIASGSPTSSFATPRGSEPSTRSSTP